MIEEVYREDREDETLDHLDDFTVALRQAFDPRAVPS